MIEEFREYLIRQGWSKDIAEDASVALKACQGNQQAQEEAVRQSGKWMDDDEHDDSGQLVDDFIAWLKVNK